MKEREAEECKVSRRRSDREEGKNKGVSEETKANKMTRVFARCFSVINDAASKKVHSACYSQLYLTT